jgi:hypothetical protein
MINSYPTTQTVTATGTTAPSQSVDLVADHLPRCRLSAAAMALGAAVQIPLGLLHPHRAQPNDSRAAFAEYAHSHAWTEVHLGQYLGTLLITIGLVTMATAMARHGGVGGQLGRIAAITALVSTAVFAVQMAVDGVALKVAVDHWASAPREDRLAAYDVADSIRSLEKGLSAFFHLDNGLTLLALGLGLAAGRRSRLVGWLGAAAGVGFLVEAVVTAETGFSTEAGTIALVPTLLLLAFLIGAAQAMWRTSDTTVSEA